tara:strand:- start:17 stop:889 length:873 start_codon:yes stop_codon:yes gene_type:complete
MNILTFDIEDWYHILHKYPSDILEKWNGYEDRVHIGTDKILEVLLENNIKATFFVLGYIAKKHPQIIKKIHDHGFEIGAHSDMHKVAYHQSSKEYKTDLVTCIKRLEDITSEKVVSYRAPGFSVRKENVWVFDILMELGIKYDASIFPAMREDGGFINFKESQPVKLKFNNHELKEFPMSMNSFFGTRFTTTGGGYFRFFPYSLIRALVEKSEYTMTYFHPRDFDPNQPVLEGLSLKRKFKSYYNLSGAYSKFKQLVKDFNFIDIRQADKLIDWEKAPIVNIDKDGNCFK